MKIYQYPNCSTCKNALKWLSARQIAHQSVHIVEQPPSRQALRSLWERSGLPLKKFFNTSGKAYRDGGFGTKLKTMSDDEALSALAENGMLIKRPILDDGETILVGFKEPAYTEHFDR